MILAWRAWKENESYAPGEAEEAHQRYEELRNKLPEALCECVFSRE